MNKAAKILCVDDDPIAREILKGIFEEEYDIATAHSGEEGLELVRSFVPDILVLDAVMPGIDGWEVCRRVKQDPATRSVKVIMVSANAVDPGNRGNGYAAGADDYIIKPYIHDDLLSKVRVWTRVRRAERQLAQKVGELQAAQRELENGKEVLEEKVRERTTELLRTNEELQAEIERRKVEEREKESLRVQLLHSQKLEAIGLLAGGVAHDFNNLLGGILGSADLLRNRLPPHSDEQKQVQRVLSCCERGAKLVRQLLTFARKNVYLKDVVSINDTVEEVSGLIESTLGKEIRVRKDLHAKRDRVLADRAQLVSALVNLAVNARDAMPGGGELTVETRSVSVDDQYCRMQQIPMVPGEYVLMAVTDTGCGMDETTRQRIFDPFFTTKEVGKGTGLGLASVYGCVQEHGGYVHVYSEPDHGSTFKIYLPLHSEDTATGDGPRSAPLRRQTAKVMLVDDDLVVRETASDLLFDIGCEVICCESGREAVERFREHHKDIDMVILDMVMPHMGGVECFSHLRSIDPAVPVVISSGHSLNGDTQTILVHPRTVFLQKPYSSAGLAHAMRRLLGDLPGSSG
jgi:signal transduction histidine kinase